MDSLKHVIKINNSYESEPSSGSGSSLSENNDCLISDDENMHLPYLLNPPSFNNEITVCTTFSPTPPLILIATPPNIHHESKSAILNKERQQCNGISAHSSQESLFEGFSDSPFGKLKRMMFGQAAIGQVQLLPVVEPQRAQLRPSPGKVLFPKFYDTILEENSCNAVDMQLSEEIEENVETQRLSGSSATSCQQHHLDGNPPSSELSFNGRIKSLTTANYQNIAEAAIEEELPTSSAASENSLLFDKHRLSTLVETESLNRSQQFTESFILKKYSNEKSPDLFDDDDDDDDEPQDLEKQNLKIAPLCLFDTQPKEALDTSANKSLNCPTESSFADEQTLDSSATLLLGGDDSQTLYRNNCRREKELLRRIRKCLDGIPPPPAVTIPQLDMFSAVLSRKDDIFNFHKKPTPPTSFESSSNSSSLFKPTHTLDETKAMHWKDILGVRQHGLSFNLNKASESNEYLSLSVIERFIGAETASSYRNSPSSAKKRNIRMKQLTQSPGNRLSHLAKRRAIFSSANLATTSQRSTSLLGPQILIDKKKNKHRRKATPKRMTPGSKKKTRKTPSSSARKRLFRSDLIKPGPSRETSKRALFQSPAKQLQQKLVATKPNIKPEIANRVEKSKRALFSPDKRSQSSSNSMALLMSDESQASSSQSRPIFSSSFQLDSLLKRKRNDEDDADAAHSSKLFRGSAENLTPRALKIKSQSFCIGAGSSSSIATTSATQAANAKCRNLSLSSSQSHNGHKNSLLLGNKLQRANSEMAAQSNSLTENQRKKLLWAVSQALQEKKVNGKHDSFKQYATVLARVVRRIFQEYYHKSSASNSETMLRLAKKYVYNVISGKNADDIYFQAKAQIDETKRQSSSRLSGYIGPEEYLQRKHTQHQPSSQSSQTLQQSQQLGSIQNLFSVDNSVDSFGISISQSSSAFCIATSEGISQNSFLGRLSQDVMPNSNSRSATKQLPIQQNLSLQKSSSKNNLAGLALRENVDCELRRSTQKNFTGKDQRNVSPYAVVVGGTSSTNLTSTSRIGSGLKTQPPTQLITELNASAAKAKRHITFDS